MGLRIALASDLAPRKIGSMEETFVAFAREAGRRGHTVEVLGRPPVHPWVARELAACGAIWSPIADVEKSFVRGSRWLHDNFDVLLYTLLPLRGRLAMQAAAAWPLQMIYLDETSTPDAANRCQTGNKQAVYAVARRAFARINDLPTQNHCSIRSTY